MLSQYVLTIAFLHINVLFWKVDKGQDGGYLDTANSRSMVDTDTARTVLEMSADFGVQPDPNSAGMTYKKYSINVQLSLK